MNRTRKREAHGAHMDRTYQYCIGEVLIMFLAQYTSIEALEPGYLATRQS